jgi:pimeloyl-ACP methyl ester carboxylesterase
MIETQCARIRTRIAGHGSRTLVFACDMPNVVESYDEIIRLLGSDFRIVCFEQTGFGFSYPKEGFRFTRRSYIDAMVEMLKVLDMGPYTLVSPCVNVFTALPVAAENPSLIEGLVLMQARAMRMGQLGHGPVYARDRLHPSLRQPNLGGALSWPMDLVQGRALLCETHPSPRHLSLQRAGGAVSADRRSPLCRA